MNLLDDILMLIDEFRVKYGKQPTVICVGPDHINELNRLEKLFCLNRFNDSLIKYRMREVVLGKKIEPLTLFGLKYHRSCANTCVY